MAHLAIVGTHSTNGVAAIHSELLRTQRRHRLRRDVPGALQQQDQRRHAAPLAAGRATRELARADHRRHRRRLDHRPRPAAPPAAARRRRGVPRRASAQAKRARQGALRRLAAGRRRRWPSIPTAIFDCQIKRIHEYKRQLLNVLHVVMLYNRLRDDPHLDVPPRTFFFAGKAAPAYHLAKLHHQARSTTSRRRSTPTRRCAAASRCVFLPNYSVTLAERLIPGQRRLGADLHRRLRGQRHQQHEVHDERRADRRHARRRHHRDGRGGRRGELLPLRPDRRAGGGQPRLVQPVLALRARAGDARAPST